MGNGAQPNRSVATGSRNSGVLFLIHFSTLIQMQMSIAYAITASPSLHTWKGSRGRKKLRHTLISFTLIFQRSDNDINYYLISTSFAHYYILFQWIPRNGFVDQSYLFSLSVKQIFVPISFLSVDKFGIEDANPLPAVKFLHKRTHVLRFPNAVNGGPTSGHHNMIEPINVQ